MRLIDADALIDGYKHMGYDPNEHPEESYMEGWCKGFNAGVDHCIGHVIHTPTIEPERKVGKWIRTRTMEHDGELYCDQCEQEHPEQKIIWNFCPNCGAKMEEDIPMEYFESGGI